ncbi:MAG: hypothetical protein BWK77_04005 [Verrucomicrobia bacterium A1]|nr:MAG: hypothetical protein BWK77_04005 [Verrucomicrobia bacterium A1]
MSFHNDGLLAVHGAKGNPLRVYNVIGDMTSIYDYRTGVTKPDEPAKSPSMLAASRALHGLTKIRSALVAVAIAGAAIAGLVYVVVHTGKDLDASVKTADKPLPIRARH